MESLRWILLVLGLLVIGAVLFFTLRERNERRRLKDTSMRASGWDHDDGFEVSSVRVVSTADDEHAELPKTPSISATDEPLGAEQLAALDAAETTDLQAADQPQEPPQRIIQLYLRCQTEQPWTGADIRTAAISEQLILGAEGFFESRNPQGQVAFYMANMLKPGTFRLNELGKLRTPGLIFFLTLPAEVDGVDAFDLMLQTAAQLAAKLKGSLSDEAQNPLSEQTAAYLRSSVVEWVAQYQGHDPDHNQAAR